MSTNEDATTTEIAKETISRYLILVVEESASSVGFYDSETGNEVGHVQVSLWPHEIAVSQDGLAYVSNFGVRDYDLSLGHAGNSVSVIDIAGRCEAGRLFTRTGDARYWAPHGLKLSPDERYLYVNVERVVGVRDPDLTRPGSEYTKLLKFERATGQLMKVLDVPLASYDPLAVSTNRFREGTVAYDVLPGTHNFAFSPLDSSELWLFSGRSGVTVMNSDSGDIIARMTDFNGAVRAIAFGRSGTLLVSATNEVSLVDPRTRTITKRFGDLGVGQILYSKLTPDERYIIAPAVWEGQVLVIEVGTGQVVHRLSTGVDPVQVVISPDESRAYVTHGRSNWLSYIDLHDLGRIAGRVKTRGGPNGMAFAAWSSRTPTRKLVLGACLPFTGQYGAEGREMRLGYQFWQDRVNSAGGVIVDGEPHAIEIAFVDTASAVDESRITAAVESVIATDCPTLMLGGYPSMADTWAGRAASRKGVPFISPFGRDPGLFDETLRTVLGLSDSDESEFEGVLQAIRHGVSPRPQLVTVLMADTPQYHDAALAAIRAAIRLGYQLAVVSDGSVNEPIRYTIGADPTTVVANVRELVPDLLLIVGGREDSLAVLRACDTLGFNPGGIALSCGITAPGFKEKAGRLGSDLFGAVQWTESAFHYAEDRFGAGVDYARLYFEEFSEPASMFAAAASAAGIVIEGALNAGAKDGASIIDEARGRAFDSFFGPIHFRSDGRNSAKPAYAVQLIVDANARLTEVPVWPRVISSGRPRWPRN